MISWNTSFLVVKFSQYHFNLGDSFFMKGRYIEDAEYCLCGHLNHDNWAWCLLFSGFESDLHTLFVNICSCSVLFFFTFSCLVNPFWILKKEKGEIFLKRAKISVSEENSLWEIGKFQCFGFSNYFKVKYIR